MSIISRCLTCFAVLVALLAVFIGACLNGVPRKLGLFTFYDKHFTMERGTSPFMLEGTPWAFNFEDLPDLSDQTALVTGANVGVGYYTALHLARKGAHVTLACRSEKKCKEAAAQIQANFSAAKVDIGVLDLSSLASVRAFSGEYINKLKRFTGLQMLVLNAGVMSCPYSLSADGIELQFATNHVGHFLLGMLLSDELQRSARATVTVVSSAYHNYGYSDGIDASIEAINSIDKYDPGKAYGQSKLANILFAQEFAERLSKSSVRVNAIHPGIVRTELSRHVMKKMENDAGVAVKDFMQSVVDSVSWSSEEGALTQLFAAASPRIHDEDIRGKYFHPVARDNSDGRSLHALNKTLQKELWDFTEKLIDSKSSP